MKTSINELKENIIKYVDYTIKANTQRNGNYEGMANDVFSETIQPFIKNETISTWEKDIKEKFLDNPYVKFMISEKQAYCLARAFQSSNPDFINK